MDDDFWQPYTEHSEPTYITKEKLEQLYEKIKYQEISWKPTPMIIHPETYRMLYDKKYQGRIGRMRWKMRRRRKAFVRWLEKWKIIEWPEVSWDSFRSPFADIPIIENKNVPPGIIYLINTDYLNHPLSHPREGKFYPYEEDREAALRADETSRDTTEEALRRYPIAERGRTKDNSGGPF